MNKLGSSPKSIDKFLHLKFFSIVPKFNHALLQALCSFSRTCRCHPQTPERVKLIHGRVNKNRESPRSAKLDVSADVERRRNAATGYVQLPAVLPVVASVAHAVHKRNYSN